MRNFLSRNFKKILLANVFAQVGIVITGGLVRVTASGLGCPTWPECVDGSIAPTSAQTESWHKYVEFGNRLLTFVLLIVAILVVLAVRSVKPGRRDLKFLAIGIVAGIFFQAILGGITVLTKLHPLTVAAHFLVSIGLITVAYNLYWRAQETGNQNFTLTTPELFRKATQLHTLIALLVIVVGTLVTGSGPHAGDSGDIERLPFDPQTITWLHADLVFLYIGLTIGLYFAARAMNTPGQVISSIKAVLLVSALQGAIGYIQYFTGLPWVLVGLHIAGACALWVVTLRLQYSTRTLSA